MTSHFIMAMGYSAAGSVVAAMGLHAGVMLAAQYARLRVLAAEQGKPVPPLVTAYFRNATRLLKLGALAFFAGAASDAVSARLAPSALTAAVLGCGGAAFLFMTTCVLLAQALADRKLGLHKRAWRVAFVVAGIAGLPVSGFGLWLVAQYGSVWP
ncbi:MAG: hypothetical protein KF696_06450 [Planctomycetes bacterium]|nr:hypothetical protein [Planctomycetota bacterium]MCW8136521.1 hypothetical protein [Planctomycetota bacterium]